MIHRNLRILFLLMLLLGVAAATVAERWWVRSWNRPLVIDLYPVAADAAGADWLPKLKPEDFQEIGRYLASEGARVRGTAVPAPVLRLQPALHQPPPHETVATAWQAMHQSLRLRWYAFRETPFWSSVGTLRVFVVYHELRVNEALPSSHGLQKGLVGVAHLFASADQRAQNNIVITHELLHLLGAKDKYDASGQPVYPEGFGDFTANPRYPQEKAEIMAGRIALGPAKSEMPASLAETVVGYATAVKIGWK